MFSFQMCRGPSSFLGRGAVGVPAHLDSPTCQAGDGASPTGRHCGLASFFDSPPVFLASPAARISARVPRHSKPAQPAGAVSLLLVFPSRGRHPFHEME